MDISLNHIRICVVFDTKELVKLPACVRKIKHFYTKIIVIGKKATRLWVHLSRYANCQMNKCQKPSFWHHTVTFSNVMNTFSITKSIAQLIFITIFSKTSFSLPVFETEHAEIIKSRRDNYQTQCKTFIELKENQQLRQRKLSFNPANFFKRGFGKIYTIKENVHPRLVESAENTPALALKNTGTFDDPGTPW